MIPYPYGSADGCAVASDKSPYAVEMARRDIKSGNE